MQTNEAIMAFSQSEKIKAGIIWTAQAIEIVGVIPEGERKGGERIVHALLNMVGHEISLAKALVKHEIWEEVEGYLNKAEVMVTSGVGQEATIHLSRALSKVTTIGQESMTLLKETKLL